MSDLETRHRELIAAVNNAKTEYEHTRADGYLQGWRDGLGRSTTGSFEDTGRWMRMIDWTDADLHHEGADADRPMCLGVFLDWQPTDNQPTRGTQ